MVRSAAEGLGAYAQPVVYADEATRGEFLRRVATYTFGGLTLASVSGIVSAMVIYSGPAFLSSTMFMFAGIMGMFFIAQNVAAGMVYNSEQKLLGFGIGMVAQGIAMGYILLAAVMVGASVYGTSGLAPFTIIFQAMGLTMLTAASMVAYLWSNPKDLSMIRGALSVMFVPMMLLMVMTFIFPIGGTIGILVSGLFVVVSGAGLMYQVNQVLHTMPAHAHVESAYSITLGMLVLFWNLLSLLMRMSSDD
jgi:FtsH-binding integral membrane protein